ncbi:unnamed protein product [Ambrosiozyma monospora]|uniref:Unnamed protein product n=1 Tax=Ambrosiozyma monospora TaxID=43982 RepID=A0ACB5U379_AMBMO|nr:unnamed protein product [Ambrosiozyma monospora]
MSVGSTSVKQNNSPTLAHQQATTTDQSQYMPYYSQTGNGSPSLRYSSAAAQQQQQQQTPSVIGRQTPTPKLEQTSQYPKLEQTQQYQPQYQQQQPQQSQHLQPPQQPQHPQYQQQQSYMVDPSQLYSNGSRPTSN